jgi:lysine 2,3-aminomutase
MENTDNSNWKWQMKNALRTPGQFAGFFNWGEDRIRGMEETAALYPMLATPFYASLAKSGELSDPIVAQCVAQPRELEPGGEEDPLGEGESSPLPRLVHRYPDRALFLTCGVCAVHCRHCMRKRLWKDTLGAPDDEELAQAVEYLKRHKAVRELLISGGDPLLLDDGHIRRILDAFQDVPNLEMLRIGTRTLVALPQRFTPELCAIFEKCRKTIWIATHFNHPQELSREAAMAVRHLMAAGVPVVNQCVLLKGINDDAETLGKLFTGLLAMRIKPYYLFHGDPIQGTACFRTGLMAGLSIMEKLRNNISGMAVPAFAFDLPRGGGKVRLEPDFSSGKNRFKRFDEGDAEYD